MSTGDEYAWCAGIVDGEGWIDSLAPWLTLEKREQMQKMLNNCEQMPGNRHGLDGRFLGKHQ